jgi:quercetin dioxygenase-like cupin family protein
MDQSAMDVLGDRVTVLAQSEAGRFELVRIETGPGRGPPPHHHGQEELFTCVAGAVEILSDGRWQRLEPGERLLVRADALHSYRALVPGTVLEALVAPAGLVAMFEELHAQAERLGDEPARIVEICERHGVRVGVG